jgi:hypothetical protein
MTRKQRTYDHRLRELVETTRDIQLATQHGVPASTARGWLNKPATEVVSLDVLDLDTMRLQHEVIQLRRRVTKLTALLPLAIVVVRVIGFSFHRIRIAWSRDERCALDDKTSCPRSSPQQLTSQEVNAIQEMVTSPEYRHVPTSSLARLAQRLGKVFASSATIEYRNPCPSIQRSPSPTGHNGRTQDIRSART